MNPGASVVIDGRVYDVMRITPEGDMLVEDVLTLEREWVDYYNHAVIDPSKDGGALLDAMAALSDDDGKEG